VVRLEFVGSSARDASSVGSNPSRLVNLWADKVEAGGKTRRLLRSTAGMVAFAFTDSIFVRAMMEMDGSIILVANDGLYRAFGGVANRLGTVEPGENVAISRNLGTVTLTTGGRYYTWDGALTEPTPGAFSMFGSVGFMAGRTLLTEAGGNKWCWSDIADPGTLPALNVATAEQHDDKIVRLMVIAGTVMLFGERSTELWAVTGEGGAAAFALLPGSVKGVGLKSFGLVTPAGEGAFIVGSDDIAYLVSGSSWIPVSNAAVNDAIKTGNPTRCFYWEDRGHKFVALGFSDRPAWVYDIATGEWFERAEGVDYQPWRAACSVKLGADWIVGADDGRLYTLGGVMDNDEVLSREATSFPIYMDGQWFSVAELEMFTGAGFHAGTASLVLEPSKDGIIWGRSRSVDLGLDGDFGKRAIFRALGRYRQFVAKVTLTDADIPIYADCRVRFA
jgi:hypothetical protein